MGKGRYEWVGGLPFHDRRNRKAYAKGMEQIRRTGVANEETYSLDVMIAMFLVPRLQRLRDVTIAVPASIAMDCADVDKAMEIWKGYLEKMIRAFELISRDSYYYETPKETSEIDEGLDLFRKYFRDLAW